MRDSSVGLLSAEDRASIFVPQYEQKAARHLRVSSTTVYRLVKDGALPCRRIGEALRFTRSDVETLLETHALDADR